MTDPKIRHFLLSRLFLVDVELVQQFSSEVAAAQTESKSSSNACSTQDNGECGVNQSGSDAQLRQNEECSNGYDGNLSGISAQTAAFTQLVFNNTVANKSSDGNNQSSQYVGQVSDDGSANRAQDAQAQGGQCLYYKQNDDEVLNYFSDDSGHRDGLLAADDSVYLAVKKVSCKADIVKFHLSTELSGFFFDCYHVVVLYYDTCAYAILDSNFNYTVFDEACTELPDFIVVAYL